MVCELANLINVDIQHIPLMQVLDGRNIKCNIAKYHPRNDAYRGGDFRGGFRGGRGSFRGDFRGGYRGTGRGEYRCVPSRMLRTLLLDCLLSPTTSCSCGAVLDLVLGSLVES